MTPQPYTGEPRPGCWTGEPAETYHEADALSHSRLKVFLDRPTLYKWRHVDCLPDPATESRDFDFGSLAHDLILEGEEAYLDRNAVIPESAPKRPLKARSEYKREPTDETAEALDWWEGFEATHPGKRHVSWDDDARARLMLISARRHPVAFQLFSSGWPELVFRTGVIRELGFALQARPDWVHDGADGPELVDLKTVHSLDAFDRQYRDLRYWTQAVFYLRAANHVLGGQLRRFWFVAVEKKPPYECGVWRVSLSDLLLGKSVIDRGLRDLSEALREDKWERLDERGDGEIELPEWFGRRVS